MLKSKDRPVPGPSYFGKEQMVQYLSDLRQTRPQRPSGARPPPSSKPVPRRAETDVVESRPITHNDHPSRMATSTLSTMPAQALAHRRTDSDLAKRNSVGYGALPSTGRNLTRGPLSSSESDHQQEVSRPVRRTPSMSYMENGSRWMEKQEVKSLRQALEDMDLEEERRIHAAAQEEASELVWKHRNPTMANAPRVFPNPDAQKDYRSHLRRGSYQRSHSQDTSSSGKRTVSDGSCKSISDSTPPNNQVETNSATRKVSPPTGIVNVGKRRTSKSYDQLAETVANDIAVAHRRSSSGSKRILSGEKQMYMHPNDKIWEDPEEEHEMSAGKESRVVRQSPAEIQPLPTYVRRNPFARVRAQHEQVERSNSAPTIQQLPAAPLPTHERVEIHRNAPSQSRNPWYISNERLPATPPRPTGHDDDDDVAPKVTPTQEGKELRSEDLRAATSKSRNDYSPKLPRPTLVSDKPGRPIVSFQKPSEIIMREEPSTSPASSQSRSESNSGSQASSKAPPRPTRRESASLRTGKADKSSFPLVDISKQPQIPTIALPDDADANLSQQDTSCPTINVELPRIQIEEFTADSAPKVSTRPAPQSRPRPRHAATAPIVASKSTPHYTPSICQSGALCAQCALPIAGRILSAGGERFHPGCFVCHECDTNLECVAFYPEPDKQRQERFERIRCRQAGVQWKDAGDMPLEAVLQQEAADGDATLRFYCHLDFHELFSPRCKSCKTPIEGEVIVACGAEWHVGHFFCAQCGDPFDSRMPFVEKDGYAWCVGCHSNRYSSKCRKCRKPVTDVVVKALGSDWHGDCFVCTECHGPFNDGRYFLRAESQDPVCVKCEELRLKA